MVLRDVLPHLSLREFVRCYRIVHLEFDPSGLIPIKAYPPKPEQCLHFFLHDFFAVQQTDQPIRQQPPVMLAGQRTFVVNQYTGSHFINVQVVFQPTALFQLTGIPAYKLTNQHLDATLIFSNAIQEILERLQLAKDYLELITIIEGFVFSLVQHAHKERFLLNEVSRYMMRMGGIGILDEWAAQACLSTKQFKRNFYESTGVNPKTYARIIRFNKAFNLKNRFPQSDWFSIALQCGYYDYQHLVKDYKDFTGLTPTEFHRLEAQSPEQQLGLTDNLYSERVGSILPL